MAVNTNRKTQAPFQPLIGEQSVATHVDKGFVEEGVVDKSTGALISAVGNNAVNAYEGYQVADTEQKVKDTVEAYTGVTVDPEEERMEGKLNRLVNGRINGGMSELEFRMRVENAVKAGIATMPGRASVFRKAAAEVLGDNDAAIDYTAARQKAATAASDKFLRDMQTHFNVSIEQLTGPKAEFYQREFAEFAAVTNMRDKATAVEDIAKLDRTGRVRKVAQGASAHAAVQAHKFRQVFESIQVNGKSVSQLRAEGMTDEDIVKTIAGDEQGRRDLAKGMSIEIRRAKEEMRHYFNMGAMSHGLTLSEFDNEIKSQEALYDGLLSALDQGSLDSDRLHSFVNSLVKRDQGTVQAILGESTAGLFIKQSLPKALELYFSGSPEYARQMLGPQVFATLERILAAPGGGKRLADASNAVATGRVSAAELANADPELASVVNGANIQTILDVNKDGFPTKTKFGENIDTDQLKETFVNNSVSVLGTIDVANKESIKKLKNIFGPAYGRRLAELPDRLQRRVTNVLKDKYDSVLGSKNHPTSVLGRLFAAEDRHAKTRDAQPKGDPRGKEPNLWVEIKNGELIHSDNSLRAPLGRRDQPRIVVGDRSFDGSTRYDFARSTDVIDHIAAVKDANLFLESRYEAATLLGEKRTWDQYLNDFYEEAYLGTKPGYSDQNTEKVEGETSDTDSSPKRLRFTPDGIVSGG